MQEWTKSRAVMMGRTLEPRERQLHDDSLSCGNQPANMRLINRRIESALLLVHLKSEKVKPI